MKQSKQQRILTIPTSRLVSSPLSSSFLRFLPHYLPSLPPFRPAILPSSLFLSLSSSLPLSILSFSLRISNSINSTRGKDTDKIWIPCYQMFVRLLVESEVTVFGPQTTYHRSLAKFYDISCQYEQTQRHFPFYTKTKVRYSHDECWITNHKTWVNILLVLSDMQLTVIMAHLPDITVLSTRYYRMLCHFTVGHTCRA